MRRSPTRSGQVVVETAITMMLYLVLIMGLIEGGLVAYSLGVLAFSVHDGTRYAILPSAPDATAVKTRVANTTSDMGVTLAQADVTVAVNGVATDAAFAARTAGDRVRVSATFAYKPVTLLIYSGTVSLSRATEMMAE